MKLLILGGQQYKTTNPAYRGTSRAHPTYVDNLPDSHEVNRMFYWFLEEGGQLGLVHNVAKARIFAGLCNSSCPGEHFEVIEVTDGEKAPENTTARFFGYDLSSYYGYSLIVAGLGTSAEVPHQFEQQPGTTLSLLIAEVFRPHLNQYGLFPEYATASRCREAMIALHSLVPNLYEGGDLSEFTIVGVYAV